MKKWARNEAQTHAANRHQLATTPFLFLNIIIIIHRRLAVVIIWRLALAFAVLPSLLVRPMQPWLAALASSTMPT